jgi:hypothetical protein
MLRLMSERRLPVSRAADVLTTILQRVDPDQELRAYRIWGFWNEEVGETIARRARPARFRNGILFVHVATHAWLQELQFMKEQIRERLNSCLGAPLVRDVFFVSGTLDESDAVSTTPAVDPLANADASIDLPELRDPQLADAFARIVAARARRIARVRKPSPTGGGPAH